MNGKEVTIGFSLLFLLMIAIVLSTSPNLNNESKENYSYVQANRYTSCIEDLAEKSQLSYEEMKDICRVYLEK